MQVEVQIHYFQYPHCSSYERASTIILNYLCYMFIKIINSFLDTTAIFYFSSNLKSEKNVLTKNNISNHFSRRTWI